MSESEILDGGNVKGGMLAAHLEWVAASRGQGAIQELAPFVSRPTAAVLARPVLAISWYPFRAVVETDRAIAQLVRGELPEVAKALGRHSARVNLGGSYRFFNRPDPHLFFEKSTRVHDQFLDFGREHYERVSSTEGRITLSDYTCRSKVFCWSALGYYERAVTLQGGETLEVTEVQCANEDAESCVFSIRWKPLA